MINSKFFGRIKSIIENLLIRLDLIENRRIRRDLENYKKRDYDLEKDFIDLYEKCKSFTLTTIERMYALYTAIKYIIKNEIAGDIVECGVWKGGSMMFSALTLLNLKKIDKKIYLYDTYEGMSEPTKKDIKYNERTALSIWEEKNKKNKKWSYSPLFEVRKNLYSTGYPKDKFIFVKGKVENTIPQIIPEKISILRLDTDWFESTYHELYHLFPKLVKTGVLIIDDYGYWRGAKNATDKYFSKNKIQIFLSRIDNTGRIAIKF